MSSGVELLIGTVTFLFTRIEGSVQLLKQLRDRYGQALGDPLRIKDVVRGGSGRDRARRDAGPDSLHSIEAFF